jgi:hypothetical protein
LVLDALEQALHLRERTETLIHHSDRGSQYVSFRYTERLANSGVERSIGSGGGAGVILRGSATIQHSSIYGNDNGVRFIQYRSRRVKPAILMLFPRLYLPGGVAGLSSPSRRVSPTRGIFRTREEGGVVRTTAWAAPILNRR